MDKAIEAAVAYVYSKIGEYDSSNPYDEVVRDAIEAYEAAKWQTMETAPKDGTMFIVYNGHAHKWVVETAYADEKYIHTKGNMIDINSLAYRWQPLLSPNQRRR